jgi:MFS family permease
VTSVWADRDFRYYWAGATVSQVGTGVTVVAVPLVALFQLHASVTEIGFLSAAEFLPYLLLTLPAGELVDRMRRRPLLIGCDAVRAVSLALIPLAALGGFLSLPLLFAVVVVVGSASVLFDVAAISVLPSLVGRDGLLQANAAIETSRSVGSVAGPGIGGALVGALKASGAIAVDAVSYVVSAFCLLMVRAPEPEPMYTKGGGVKSLGVGLRQVRRSPVLRPQVTYLATSGLLWGAVEGLLIVFSVRDLGLSGPQVGLVAAVGNVGAVVGALTSRMLALRVGLGNTLVIGATGTVLGSALVAAAPASYPLPWLLGGQFLVTLTVLWFNIQSVSLRQAVTPGQVLGRVNAAVRLLGFGALPIGAAVGGVLGGAVGMRETLIGATALSIIPTVVLALSPLRPLKTAPDEEPVWD